MIFFPKCVDKIDVPIFLRHAIFVMFENVKKILLMKFLQLCMIVISTHVANNSMECLTSNLN